jgi:putative membrane protein
MNPLSLAEILPHVNAVLNSVSTVLLILGFALIRTGRRDLHRKVMITALIVSSAFLICYLIYHFTAPVFVYRGPEWSRPVYFTLLISHVVLATLVTPMVAVTAWRSLHGDFVRHRAIARWTLPIWLYVTVTGVVIYVILYHLYPTVA